MARRMLVSLACIGIDLRPVLRHTRNAILRPIRHELVAARTAWREELGDEARALQAKIQELDARVAEIAARLETEQSERRLRVATLESLITEARTVWLPAVEQRINDTPSPIVSVILPTRDRAHAISDSITSVKAQHFTDWELIIVDDGSSDDTAAMVAPYLADTRIRYVEQSARGVSRARNHGLELARGALIAYLDSDNVWYPDFLAAAVNAFAADPTVNLIYGVLVTDAHGLDGTRLLWMQFDRDRLMSSNFIDMNVVVHRKSLVERYGVFDEQLDRVNDWDLILRYTEHAPARPLLVLAARYRIYDNIRITNSRPYGPNYVAIKRKWYPVASTKRQPRVLYALWQYPQLSETYVETEIRCMLRWGVHVEVWRKTPPASPYPASVPIHDDSLADAVRRVQPDVIHVHWFNFAASQEGALGELGLPVTIRAHGFEVTLDGLRPLLDRPWVRAIYVFPHQLHAIEQTDPRLSAVPVAFDTTLFQPHAQKDRRLVIRACAALASKDIPFFFELAKRLPDHRFVLAAVTCTGVESYGDELRDIRWEMNSPAELMFDVPREDLVTLIAQAGIYLHTARPPGTEHATPIGIPISIAEAMATGAHVLVRDIPELRAFVGNAGTTYRDVEHATEIITTIAAWSERAWTQSGIASLDRAFLIHADELALRPIFEDWCAMVRSGPQA